jgi:hypothetical protein
MLYVRIDGFRVFRQGSSIAAFWGNEWQKSLLKECGGLIAAGDRLVRWVF